MNGWLLDTNVIASLTSPNGAPTVRAWAARQDEDRLLISILTVAEFEKGIHNLPAADPARHRYIAALASLEERFAGRILSVSDAIVRRWGTLSGTLRRDTGHPPPVIDTMLAATAIEHQLCLVTRNVCGTWSGRARSCLILGSLPDHLCLAAPQMNGRRR